MTINDVEIINLDFDAATISEALYDGNRVFTPKHNTFQYANLAFIVNESDYEDMDELDQTFKRILHRKYGRSYVYHGCEDITEDFKEGGIWS